MKSAYKVANQFVSAISDGSSVDAVSESGSFTVNSVTRNGYSLPDGYATYFIILDYNTANEEIFRIYRRVGNVLHWDKRIPYPNGKKSHGAGAVVQLNDVAELINEVAKHVDNFGYVEKVSDTVVKVYGGMISYGMNLGTTLPDASFTVGAELVNGVTQLVGISYVTGSWAIVQTIDAATFAGAVVASVTVSGGTVTTITDARRNQLRVQFDPAAFAATAGRLGLANGSIGLSKWAQGGATAGQVPYWTGTEFAFGNPVTVGGQTRWGVFQIAGTGAKTISGLPFRPKRLEFVGSNASVSDQPATFHSYVSEDDFGIPEQTFRNVVLTATETVSGQPRSFLTPSSDFSIAAIYLRYEGITPPLSLVSAKVDTINSDGFTLNVTDATFTTNVFYIAYSD